MTQVQIHTFYCSLTRVKKTHRHEARQPGEPKRQQDVVVNLTPDLCQINCSLQIAPAAISTTVTADSILYDTIRNAHTIKEPRKKKDRRLQRHREGEEERLHKREWARNRQKEKQKGWRDDGEMGAEKRAVESESWNDNGKSPSVSQYAGRQPQGATVWYEYQEAGWLGEILDWITSPAPSATLLACRQSHKRDVGGWRRDIGKLRIEQGQCKVKWMSY